jgi:CheY-like chemotaxis protein
MIYDEAESGLRAVELLRSAAAEGRPYDLAILDLMMPGMDGFELARTIKSDQSIAAVRMILLTSYGKRGDGEIARDAGVSAYLTKPVRQSQLYDCLTNVVSDIPVAGEEDLAPKPSKLITKYLLKEARQRLILLAEDNIVNQKVAVRQLEKLGYRPDTVTNGSQAVQALLRTPYDLVLMDCQMPEMDGYEATAEIRRREGTRRHTTIVAMTANALEGDRERCLAAGMDDYISKPVNPEELARLLERVFTSSGETVSKSTDEEPEAPVDLERLHEALGEELSEILELYMSQMTDNLRLLKVAIEAGDTEQVESIAHSCVGTSANCGMVAVVPPLRALETAGRQGSLEGGTTLLEEANRQFERISLFLETELKQTVA